MGTTLKIFEKSTQHSNLAERYVDLTKTSIRKDMRKLGASMVLWGLCAKCRMRINNLTDWPLFQIQGQNIRLATFGEEGDISNVFQFKLYEWAYAMDGAAKFQNQAQFLCRFLCPTKNDVTRWHNGALKRMGR